MVYIGTKRACVASRPWATRCRIFTAVSIRRVATVAGWRPSRLEVIVQFAVHTLRRNNGSGINGAVVYGAKSRRCVFALVAMAGASRNDEDTDITRDKFNVSRKQN